MINQTPPFAAPRELASPPIFIFSCQRSGSTLLRYLVDGHPEICCPGHLFLGDLCQNLYYAAYYSVAQLPLGASEAEREAIAVTETRNTVSALMARYAAGKQKKTWCEKTALNVDQLTILKRVFPEAKNICLYRHCLDVVHSCLKYSPYGFMRGLASYVQRNPDNIVAAMVECWVERTGKLLDFEKENAERCCRVTYESLVLRPEETLAALFHFLGFAWEAHWLDRAFSYEHGTGDGDLKVGFSQQIKRDSIGKGATIPLVYLPEALQAKANRLLVELGYPPLGSSPEVIPISAREGAVGLAPKPMAERVKHIFAEEFPAAIHRQQERFQTLKAKCQFTVSGVADGHWIIDLTSREPAAQVRAGQEDADCTIAVSAPVLIELVEGTLNPIEAYEARKIGGSGNVDLAIKFGQLLLSQ